MTRHTYLKHCKGVDSDYEEEERKNEWATFVKEQKDDPAPPCPRTGKKQARDGQGRPHTDMGPGLERDCRVALKGLYGTIETL